MNSFYTLEDYQNNKFDQLPKVLRKGKYKTLSNNARVLYAVLKERHELSVRNRWVDDEGRIYFYFAQKDLAEECCISPSTVWRSLQDLHKIGLINTKRQGLQLNNIMYLCKPDLIEDMVYENENNKTKAETLEKSLISQNDKSLNSQNDKSGIVKMTNPDLSKRRTNNTKYNKTKMNQTEINPSINQKANSNEKMDGLEYSETFVKKLVDYESLIKTDETIIEDVDGIIDIISDVLNSKNSEIKVNGEDKPINVVRSRYLKLNMFHLLYVLESLSGYSKKIMDPKAWMITALYNAPSTMPVHYTNRYNIDEKRLE